MTRKIILSRKGFDSGYGGMPSAFVADGEMVSFPIPHAGKYADPDLARYADIAAEGMSLRARMEALHGGDFASQWDRCHHDPDLQRGVFGQSGPPQTILKNGEVGIGDLFLFFGWFREAERNDGALRFRSPKRDVHALFGYLQIGEILSAREAARNYPRLRNHPHLTPFRLKWDQHPEARKPNMVYRAAERLSFPGLDGLPGYGVFRHAPELVLTAKSEKRRSFWDLPEFFDGKCCQDNLRRIKDGRRKGLCTTKGQWQECVVNSTPEIQEWALQRIRAGLGLG